MSRCSKPCSRHGAAVVCAGCLVNLLPPLHAQAKREELLAKLHREKQASEAHALFVMRFLPCKPDAVQAKHQALQTEHEELESSVLSVVVQSMSMGPQKLEEQPEKVAEPRERHSCILCGKDANYALIPCGHACYCHNCAPNVKDEWKWTCPVCRDNYTGGLRVYT